MKVLHRRNASLTRGVFAVIAVVAIIMGAAATASLAAGEAPAIQTGFNTPVVANEEPAPPGTGPNQGDTARARMQDDPQAFAALGNRYPPAPGAGNVAGVNAGDAQLHGRAGWNPALVQLQAKPIPFPWENPQAAANPASANIKTASAPTTQTR